MPSILVVDDDKAIQEMLTDLLEAEGYQIDTTRDGRETLETLLRDRYDLVILDVLIPKINGFALIEQIRANPQLRNLSIIMMSGIYRSRNHRTEMANRYQVIEYLDKPLDTAQLLDLVHRAVGPGAKKKKRKKTMTPAPLEGSRAQNRQSGRSDQNHLEPAMEHLVDLATHEERREVESDARNGFRTSAFLFQGPIRKNPVASVLGKLWHQRDSGGLLLRNQKIKKIVYLRDGNPYAVKSNLISECLGQILVRERMLTDEECTRSIEQMKLTGMKQGEILVEMRCITEKNLAFALEVQLESKLFDPFAWEGGEFRFNSSAPLPTRAITLEWQGPSLIAEGIRRTFDETRLRSLMVPILDVPLAFREQRFNWPDLRLSAGERKAIRTIQAGQSCRELLEAFPVDPPDGLRLVYTLIALELIGSAR